MIHEPHCDATNTLHSPLTDEGAFYSRNVIYRGNYANGIGTCISTASCNTRGGALYLSVPSVHLRNNTFDSNFVSTVSATTEAQGGALYSTNLYNAIQQTHGRICIHAHSVACPQI